MGYNCVGYNCRMWSTRRGILAVTGSMPGIIGNRRDSGRLVMEVDGEMVNWMRRTVAEGCSRGVDAMCKEGNEI